MPITALKPPSARLIEIDGFRAMAVVMVMAFHYFSRFPEFTPYSDRLFPLSRLGVQGVEFFFIISGFVIAHTLQSSRSIGDFLFRRAIRLWPSMLVCSVITFAVVHTIETPFTAAKPRGVADFLPSLTFTHPQFWTWLVPDIGFVDGSYWSLFVEVRFYFWASILAFVCGKQLFLRNFLGLAVLACTVEAISRGLGFTQIAGATRILFFTDKIPFFCAGVLFHALFTGRRDRWIMVSLGFSLLVILSLSGGLEKAGARLIFFALFGLLIWRRNMLRPFTWPVAQWIGLCSYPLYLLHQNIGVSLITLVPAGLHAIVYYVLIACIAGLMLAIASVIHLAVERPMQFYVRRISDSKISGPSNLSP